MLSFYNLCIDYFRSFMSRTPEQHDFIEKHTHKFECKAWDVGDQWDE